MDKYEMKVSMEEIKELVAEKKYREASDIAKTLNWHKVKDYPALSAAITAHEKVGEIEEARDMAILAYNRNLGGKKLVYELTTLMIKLKQFDEADELFREYEKMAPHDVNRYILFYELKKAEGAPNNMLVEILEEYKKEELDEKYMYELAKLYSKTGRKTECIQACDDIAVLFQDGTYVVKALKMKQFHGAPLTESQAKKLDEAKARRADMEITREMLFQQQMTPSRFNENKEVEINEMLDGTQAKRSTQDLGSMMEAVSKKAQLDEDVDYTEFETELDENGVNRKLKRRILAMVAEATEAENRQKEISKNEEPQSMPNTGSGAENTEEIHDEAHDETQEVHVAVSIDDDIAQNAGTYDTDGDTADAFIPKTDVNEEAAASAEDGIVGAVAEENTDAAVISGTNQGSISPDDKIGQASESLKDLIANAKKKIEARYDTITQESEQERLEQERAEAERHIREREDSMQIEEVAVPGNNIYDTQNLQAEIAKNLNAVLEEDDLAMLRPNPPAPVKEEEPETPEDEQIEGQMSIADWIETVREEKYGSQNTKEYSKTELNRLLDQKEENSAAYEKLLAEKKAARQGETTKSKELTHTQEMLVEAKTDLALRTGKASQKLEEAVGHLKEAAAAAGGMSDDAADYTVSDGEDSFIIEKRTDSDAASLAEGDIATEVAESVRRESTAAVESISLDTAQIDMVSDEMLAQYVEQATADDERPFSAQTKQKQSTDGESAKEDDAPRKISPRAAAPKAAPSPAKEQKEQKLDPTLARFFKKYKDMPGLESELAEYFAALPEEMKETTSRTGNILISGNSSSDKYDLAKAIVRAINSLYPDNPKKIAKTTGESINYRGIAKSMERLHGTVLVVEGAGVIQPKRVSELLACMDKDTNRMIVILEDADAEINMLLEFNPELTKRFNHRIILKQYTVNELVEMAKKFARRRSYEVDDDALLELYLRIDKLHTENDNIKLDDVKEIINRAIEHSEKRASRKIFKGIKKKHTDNGDLIYLTESDFKD